MLCGQSTAYSSDQKRAANLAVIKLLTDAVENGDVTDMQEKAFCLWNISDSFAMLRDSESLYKNHRKLEALVDRMTEKYLFYPVCDTTQRFTLALGGAESYWFGMYKKAVEANSEITAENECIAYEAHRAAMAVNPRLNIDPAHTDFSRDAFEGFLSKCQNSIQYDFYRLIFLSSVMTAYGEKIQVGQLCEKLLPDLCSEDAPEIYVTGEWEKLNKPRSSKNRAAVGIIAAVNALININDTDTAIEIYSSAKKNGLAANGYIENRLKYKG